MYQPEHTLSLSEQRPESREVHQKAHFISESRKRCTSLEHTLSLSEQRPESREVHQKAHFMSESRKRCTSLEHIPSFSERGTTRAASRKKRSTPEGAFYERVKKKMYQSGTHPELFRKRYHKSSVQKEEKYTRRSILLASQDKDVPVWNTPRACPKEVPQERRPERREVHQKAHFISESRQRCTSLEHTPSFSERGTTRAASRKQRSTPEGAFY